MAKDNLGDRMKSQYEDRTRHFLPRRTHTIIRIDGKAFHTYTRDSCKPFDYELMRWLDVAAQALCQEAQCVRCAYGQSDEYSFLLQDFGSNQTEAWFDGNIQKIVSVAASIFTVAFAGVAEPLSKRTATFDARVFTIPDLTEVENYFIWRQQDATRNAILSAGQSQFSPNKLHGKNTSEVQEMLFQERGINFNDYPVVAKRGRCVVRETYSLDGPERSRWVVDLNIPVFTQDRDYFKRVLRFSDYERNSPEVKA